MEFRVTVGLGQDDVDAGVLEGRAAALQESVAKAAAGDGATVVVDLVKAALQVVVQVEAADGLGAAQLALEVAERGVREAELRAPASILTLEAEAIPAPAQDHLLRPHPAQGGVGD